MSISIEFSSTFSAQLLYSILEFHCLFFYSYCLKIYGSHFINSFYVKNYQFFIHPVKNANFIFVCEFFPAHFKRMQISLFSMFYTVCSD